MFCIYLFSDEDLFPKYIGKAKNFTERYNQHINQDRFKYDTWFYRWLNKQIREDKPFYVDVLQETNQENWRIDEIYWIKHFRELGYEITNMTDGGDGNNNQVFSKETQIKKSNSLKGHKVSPETRLKLSKAHTGKVVKESTKQKLREHNLGKPCPKHVKESFQRVVLQLDIKGELIKEFQSLTEAAKSINCRKSSLSNVINRKKSGIFKGFKWKYK